MVQPADESNRQLNLEPERVLGRALAEAVRPANEWSYSRHRLLNTCERAMYWQYWGSRGGYRTDAPAEARQAWALKGLVSVPTLIGTAVHNAARDIVSALRDRRALPVYETLLRDARTTLNKVWRWSQPNEIDRFWQWPTTYHAFHEIVYRGQLEQSDIEHARIKVASCLRHLVASPLLDDVRECLPERVRLGGSGPDRVSLGDGVIAWMAPDLLYHHSDPSTAGGECRNAVGGPCWCITDYKSGKPSLVDDTLQLAGYALAVEAQGYPMTDGIYFGRIIYLLSGTERWITITLEDMAKAQAVVRADIETQRGFYTDLARGLLQPPSSFSLAADTQACVRCNFLELCRDELAEESHASGSAHLHVRVGEG